MTCVHCHVQHYCSKLCLKLDAKRHKKECKSPEWKAAEAAADKARESRLARYEARAEEERAREKAATERRKAQAEEARRRQAGERPYTLPGESHRQPKEKPAATKPITELLSQRRWREEKPLRAAAFDEKQAKEHAEAVARKEQARLDAARAAEAEASKNLAAALHVVPPKPTLSLACEAHTCACKR